MPDNSPKAIATLSTRQQVLNLALQGFTRVGIAEALSLSPDSIDEHLIAMRQDLSLRSQEAQEVWVAVTIARTEKILTKIMPIFDDITMPPIKNSYADGEMSIQTYMGLVSDAAKAYTLIAKLQKDILQVKIESPGGTKFVQNNTIVAAGDFYKEALAAMQSDLVGSTYDEYMQEAEELMPALPSPEEDPRIIRIEQTLEKLNLTHAETRDEASP